MKTPEEEREKITKQIRDNASLNGFIEEMTRRIWGINLYDAHALSVAICIPIFEHLLELEEKIESLKQTTKLSDELLSIKNGNITCEVK